MPADGPAPRGPGDWKVFTRDVYAPRWGAEPRDHLDSYLANVLELLKANAGPRVLEVGVGTGEPFAAALASGTGGLVGIDISRALAEMARRNVTARGHRIEAVAADAEDLPFASDRFDLVYSVSSTWYFPDFPLALREMARVAKPGGAVVFDVINWLHPSQAVTFAAAHAARLGRIASARLRGRPEGPPVINWTPRLHRSIVRAAREAGLSVRTKGFMVLLPVSLPRIGEKANLAGRVRLTATGLQDCPIVKHLGAKLLYVCRKR